MPSGKLKRDGSYRINEKISETKIPRYINTLYDTAHNGIETNTKEMIWKPLLIKIIIYVN